MWDGDNGKGIDQLAHCKRLRHLDLSNNQQLEMNEEVFKMLSRLKQLRCLNMMTTSKLALAGEKDQQLKYVTTLKHLDKLIIHRNQFTPEAVTALQSAMPHLEIAFERPRSAVIGPLLDVRIRRSCTGFSFALGSFFKKV